ncbi:hypothetical protein [Prosthecochloris sp. GSB1]|uniref:hypothetical protein n=1 Tax=Prosthecochloris sp. GSB1 TaxID=281093 RepID=UPI001F32F3C2|nr:hypothetical protein [Prosthecochloris sp. GSB1]
MNKKNDRITEEIRKTMEVLNNLPELEAHYLFRARLMETVSRSGPISSVKLSNAAYGFKLALVALLLAVNIGTAMLFMGPAANDSEPAFSRNDMLESLKNDYGSPALSYYTENDSGTADNDE